MAKKTKRKWDRLSDDEKQLAIRQLIEFFEVERDEKIGVIAADEILSHVLQTVGVALYNKGIEDARNALRTRLDELNYDLDDLIGI